MQRRKPDRGRRTAVVTAILAAGLPAGLASVEAHAGASGGYPGKALRIVEAFPSGGGLDYVARTLAPKRPDTYAEQQRVVQRQDARERFAPNAMEAVSGSPEVLSALLKRHVGCCARVVKRAEVKHN